MPDTLSDHAPIDEARLQAMMDELSVFGGGPDGAMTRLTLSKEDGAARDWLAGWFSAQGFTQAVDAIGNQFGSLILAGANAPVVMVGSHIDSQPNGGRFDGALGVVSACEAVLAVSQRLKAEGKSSLTSKVVADANTKQFALEDFTAAPTILTKVKLTTK